ncbi:hypothetical protein ColTof4_14029 [Colletotrichum tofieldiae]|nr:hypothetical protein ColTof3_14665 [Colletotrichum tofieldiae]GKT81606.1 hypothetical protein ColTof4_14029 [Colletotrichum tofieldiae]
MASWPIAPRELALPPKGSPANRNSYTFHGRVLGKILRNNPGSPCSKLVWRPSDNLIMKSFLAFNRLCVPTVRAMAHASSFARLRQRHPSKKFLNPDPSPHHDRTDNQDHGHSPDLFDVAEKMNIDLPSLSEHEWAAICCKMVSTMTYVLDKNLKNGALSKSFRNDSGEVALHWPDQVRDAWTHQHWWGDEAARVDPDDPEATDREDDVTGTCLPSPSCATPPDSDDTRDSCRIYTLSPLCHPYPYPSVPTCALPDGPPDTSSRSLAVRP